MIYTRQHIHNDTYCINGVEALYKLTYSPQSTSPSLLVRFGELCHRNVPLYSIVITRKYILFVPLCPSWFDAWFRQVTMGCDWSVIEVKPLVHFPMGYGIS